MEMVTWLHGMGSTSHPLGDYFLLQYYGRLNCLYYDTTILKQLVTCLTTIASMLNVEYLV